ncbi:AMP-binding protein [Nocardioides mangrovi]|uniref:AMP-binding protein n=1 Tax=Nocardioides mangrovi TaxID=2874580 RepID=A0ABS7UGT0_9ACTN|nr:AMP-binding protein [Nocardioides mangrovi]MBZ5740246.1 AMP-binding protein [Nocardioides mangrovi]
MPLLQKVRTGVGAGGTSLKVLGRAGVIRLHPPVALAKAGKALQQWGVGPAGGFAAAALLAPRRVAVIDELGSLTYDELHRRSNALARAFTDLGVSSGDGVAVMCRNHRGFIDASLATAKVGADILYLNTAFAGPQLVEVLGREKPKVVVFDQEFASLLAGADVPERVLGWVDEESDLETGAATVESLIAGQPDDDLQPADRHGRIVILTSGTTGTPKGAPRSEAGIEAAVSLLSRMPLRWGWRTHIAAPLFHTWGFAHLALAMLLNSTMVLRRRFDPEACLQVIESERCDSVAVIPVMLQRILTLPEETLARYDLSRVKVVASSGSALPGDLAIDWMDHFGDHLYNIYGSTEVAYASIATPEDLRADPAAAGKPPYATVVKILDPDGTEVPAGETGRIFVGNGLLFEGYTGGGSKEVVDGLMSTGDVGRFDADGRLHVEGRDDEMIVSGGENVFPKEVEDSLMRHEAVVEVAAVGVDDPDFGKRLRAYVVVRDGVETGTLEDELRAHVKDNLARYKVPRDIVFLPELPRNATGKVLKRELSTD